MPTAKNMNKDRKTIGVFISRVGRVWGLEFMAGVTAAAEASDVNLVCFVGGKPTAIITPGYLQSSYGLYDLALTEQLAGIIICGDLGYDLDEQETRLFVETYSHIPLIVNALQVEGAPNLISDNMGGMRAVVSHLIDEHGYKQIAFICGPQHQVEAEQRLLAYKQELAARDMVYDNKLVVPGDFSPESGRTAIRILLDERKVEVDAIIAANDRMAIGAFEALQLRGIQVPGDIALTGFDDVREARALGVPLTTVRQPFYDMGKQAVELLLQRIAGEPLAQDIIHPTQLIVRWSCGCLPESIKKVIVNPAEVSRTGHLDNKKDAALRSMLLAAEIYPDSALAARFVEAAGQTWDRLMDSLHDRKDGLSFLHSVELLINTLLKHSDDASIWHNLISTLRKHILAGLHKPDEILHAENLFQQARMLTGELSQRVQALRRLEMEQQEEVLQGFSFSMAPAMSLEEIGLAVERNFPAICVQRLYVMLYASMATPQSTLVPPSENYHLLLQYDEAGFQLPANQPKWATGRLIPHGKTPEDRRYTAIVMPLTLAQNRFGFLWMEMNSSEWEVYARIRNLISSALLRTMLVQQRTLAQKEVEHLLDESNLREVELALAKEKAETNALENARLYLNEQERRKEAESLSKAARNLSTLLKMDEVPQQILKQLTLVLPYERGALLMEELNGTTRVVAHSGFPEDPRANDLRIQIDAGGVYDQIERTGEPVIIEDVTTSSSWQQVDWLPINHSWMGIPLFSKNKVIGMLSLTRAGINAFSRDDLLLVTTYGMQAAIALENARLYDEVTRFNEMMERMVSQRVEELNSAYTTLEKLDKNKTSFIQISAHELRTPITVMKGYLGMLKGNPAIQNNDELVQAVDGVLKGTDRLHQIVNSMLDVARLDDQHTTPKMEDVVVGLVMQLVQKEYKSDMAERNIRFVVEEGIGRLPLIQADPLLLRKALDAIIVNAIKFTPDAGIITFGAKVVNDERIGQCVEMQVRDTGIGIDQANHRAIFEKLFQIGKVELHSSGRTKFKGGGPGLGLALAAGIVKAHKGKIWVESPGCNEEACPGSTFFIRLPIS